MGSLVSDVDKTNVKVSDLRDLIVNSNYNAATGLADGTASKIDSFWRSLSGRNDFLP
jgi:hypothetical protein